MRNAERAEKGSDEKMNKATRAKGAKGAVEMALLAGLLLLAALMIVLQPAATTSDRGSDPAIQAASADGIVGSSMARDPYIERHAEAVAFFREESAP